MEHSSKTACRKIQFFCFLVVKNENGVECSSKTASCKKTMFSFFLLTEIEGGSWGL